MATKQDVINALGTVSDTQLKKDIVSLHLVEDVQMDDGVAAFTLKLPPIACPLRTMIEEGARQAVMKLPGVKEVKMKNSPMLAATRPESEILLGPELKGVKNVIAVGSGKGGVGKSTVAVNLALALASGAKVGILDADIYGPNVPLMLGLEEKQKIGLFLRESLDEKIKPLERYGLKVVSLGSFYREETPLMWRGGWVSGAINMLLTDVEWGELDYLVCDLPPGTGDASLTLSKSVPLGGVVIVTTPPKAAHLIASKSLLMFRRLNVPVLGIIENMSYLSCPNCEEKIYPFSSGGGRLVAASQKVDFLGELPLDTMIGEHADAGTPLVASMPDSAETNVFKDLAFRVIVTLAHLPPQEKAGDM